MSYPWWKFHVEFEDGHEEDFIAEGLAPSDALKELLESPYIKEDALGAVIWTHGEVKVIEYRGIVEPDIPGPKDYEARIVEVSGERDV